MASRALFVCIVGLLAVGLVDVVLPVSANIQQIGVIQDNYRPFWMLLMINPYGLSEPPSPRPPTPPPSCDDLMAPCSQAIASACCSGSCSDSNQCCQPSGLNVEIGGAFQCCSGSANAGTCCTPDNSQISCQDDSECCLGTCAGDNICDSNTCFEAQTQVHIKESPTPIPIEQLKTGQHVLCMDTKDDDMRLPTKTKWCKVHAWLHATPDTVNHVRINLAQPAPAASKTAGAAAKLPHSTSSLTIRPNHLVLRLTAPSLAKGSSTVASVHEFGAFESVAASDIKAGDTLAVLADASKPSSAGGFTAVSVASVQEVQAAGAYTPIIDSPYIIANGAVALATKNFRGLVTAPTGVDGAKPAAQHYLFAPIYMQNNNNKHPVGVSGKEAKAKGADAEAIFAAIHAAQAPFVRAGKALNYEAVRDWWKPRNAAFKADPSKSVSVDDVVAFLQSDAAWLHPAVGKTDKVQRIVSIDKSKPFEAP